MTDQHRKAARAAYEAATPTQAMVAIAEALLAVNVTLQEIETRLETK